MIVAEEEREKERERGERTVTRNKQKSVMGTKGHEKWSTGSRRVEGHWGR